MLNQNQDILPYAYNMQNNLPSAQGVNQAAIPSLAPGMQNPLLNSQSFMPSGVQPGYAKGGSVMSSMMDSRFTQPHSQYRHGGLARYAQGGSALNEFINRGLMSQQAAQQQISPYVPQPVQPMNQQMQPQMQPQMQQAQYANGGSVMSSMMDSRFTQPHSQYADGGLAHYLAALHHNHYANGGQVEDMGRMEQMAEQLRQQGQDGDTVLAHISPEEQELLQTLSGGTEYNRQTHLPQYGIGKFFKKAAKVVAPVLGSVVGGALGGPGGAALGGALAGGLTGGKKNMLRNAALGGLGGYALQGGFGNLGGIGGLGGKVSQALGMQGLQGAFGLGGAGGASTAGAAGLTQSMGGLDKWMLPLGLVAGAGTLLGKTKTPKDTQDFHENIANVPKWGPEHQAKRVKPYKRIAKVVNAPYSDTSEQQFFEDTNPEVEYYAHGGYLDGHTGGQDDKIPAELSDGEYVISADVVSFLGDGNNKAGAKKLDGLMMKARNHRNKGGTKLPPKSKGLEHYLQRSA